MYRLPEKQIEIWTVSNCSLSCFFISMQITYPFAYFPSKSNILTFLPLFDLLCFILYYFCASCILSCEFTLSKGRKKLQGNVEFTTTAIRIYFSSLTLMQISLHLADFAGDKNVAFHYPDACLFGHPFYFDCQVFITLASDFISTF